jgi:ATP-dependent Clp protease ATP-binding subunit ClpA
MCTLAGRVTGREEQNESEGRFKALLDQARDDHRTILFLDEVHLLCAPTNDVSQMVKADLGRGRMRCISATTTREWRTIEADAALARRFQVIPVGEPSPRRSRPWRFSRRFATAWRRITV